MKARHIYLYIYALLAVGLAACVDQHDEPAAGELLVTSTTSVGETNTTIAAVKARFCSGSSVAETTINSNNYWSKVTENLVLEGVVVGNDEGENMYQTLLLRDINAAAGSDQCIGLKIRNTFLSPYFPLGQRVKVNLKGLYVGVYSAMPVIGQPYITSMGNKRLGAMLLELCRKNIELIGKPNRGAPELIPIVLEDAWLQASANRNYNNTPILATVKGVIAEVQGAAAATAEIGANSGEAEPLPKIYGPEALYDDGYAVNRHIVLGNNYQVTLRTSTDNAISFTAIPSDSRSYTGMLSYYGSEWQMTLRSLDDIYPSVK
ncbi:MAG: hypothetical protein IJ722_02515 [Alloprevotella sp.]|nr:hypothetical protein [Alloprevotella sp.]